MKRTEKKYSENRRKSQGFSLLRRAVAAALALSLAVGAGSAQAATKVLKNVVYYRVAAIDYPVIKIKGNNNFKINLSSVKNSDSSVLYVSSVSNEKTSSKSYGTNYGKKFTSSYTRFDLMLYKAGTSEITFNKGSKSYAIDVTVKDYTNPLEILKISGVKNGENIAGKVDEYCAATLKLKKTVKNAKLRIRAKSGWGITSVEVTETAGGSTVNQSREYRNPKTGTVTLPVGTLNKKSDYEIAIKMKNLSDGGTIKVYYSLL